MALLKTLPVILEQEAIQKLQSNIKGAVITPDHSEYDSTREAWNLIHKHQSAVIVVAEESSDVGDFHHATKTAHSHHNHHFSHPLACTVDCICPTCGSQ